MQFNDVKNLCLPITWINDLISVDSMKAFGGSSLPHPGYRRTQGALGDHGLPKFLEHIVILCFERRYPKQNRVFQPKIKYFGLPQTFLAPQFWGWLRYCPWDGAFPYFVLGHWCHTSFFMPAHLHHWSTPICSNPGLCFVLLSGFHKVFSDSRKSDFLGSAKTEANRQWYFSNQWLFRFYDRSSIVHYNCQPAHASTAPNIVGPSTDQENNTKHVFFIAEITSTWKQHLG